MANVSQYSWLAPVWRGMQQALMQDRVPGAVLLQAAPELGADALIAQFVQTLLCRNQNDEPCGFCHSCELFASNNHPDLHRVFPEKAGKSIGVEQIRSCNRVAQESSQLGGYRVFVIEPAEAMNTSASNALLKTLEEPGAQCCFVLVTTQKHRLLPTIVSRCQQWHVAEPSLAQSRQWLADQATDVAPALLKLAQQSPLRAKTLAEEKGWAQYQSVEQAAIQAFCSDEGDYQPLVDALLKDTSLRLTWLWYLLTDTQKRQHGVVAEDSLPGSEALSRLSPQGVYTAAHSLVALKQQMGEFPGLNEELLVTNWIIESREKLCL